MRRKLVVMFIVADRRKSFVFLFIIGTTALTAQLQCAQAQPLQMAETGPSGELKVQSRKLDHLESLLCLL